MQLWPNRCAAKFHERGTTIFYYLKKKHDTFQKGKIHKYFSSLSLSSSSLSQSLIIVSFVALHLHYIFLLINFANNQIHLITRTNTHTYIYIYIYIYKMNLNSSHAIMVTFGLMSFDKVIRPLSPHPLGKYCHWCFFYRMVLSLNYLRRFIYH